MTLPNDSRSQVSPADFRWVLIRAVLLPLVLSAALAGVFLWQINRLTTTARSVEHTDEVISQATEAQKLLIDMETGVRGYLITADHVFLEPYEQAMPKVSPRLGELRRLVSDNPGQGRRLDEVEQLHARWSLYARDVIALKEKGGEYQTRVGAGEGKRLLDAMRAQFDAFVSEEETLRDERSRSAQSAVRWAVVGGLLVTAVLGALLAFFVRRQLVGLSGIYGRALGSEREQRELLDVTLRSIGDAVIATADKAAVTFMNGVAETLTGWKGEEARGQSLAEVFRIVNERTRETVESPADRVLREGKVVGLANHTILLGKDGVERPIDDSGAPIKDARGSVVGVVLVFRDITERKLEEQERERLEAERREAETARLALQDEVIGMQKARLEELSTPLIPLSREIVIMPLVGTVDAERATLILDAVSRGITTSGAGFAVIDITGVPTVDTHVAGVLVRAAQTVRLLGAEVVLTGIRPGVAQTLVGLRVELGGLVTRKDLRSGVEYALSRLRADAPPGVN
jgi:PAS domain S-box-containing protein